MVNVAGWRSSYYGSQGNGHGQTDPNYFVCVAQKQAAKFPGSKQGGIWVLGGIGTSETNMPFAKPPGAPNITNVVYDTSGSWGPDPEPFLSAYDAAGMEIILQVEPGMANISQLATMVLNNFKKHPCVKGFGVDVEWWNSSGSSNDKPIPASVVTSLVNAVHAVNSSYKIVIKHYDPTVLPKGIAGVTYLNDTCGLGSFDSAVSEYVAWANNFSGSEVGYQMLYVAIGSDCTPDDHKWWGSMTNPDVQLINGIRSRVPAANIYCAYIVDFSLGYTYPTCSTTVTKYRCSGSPDFQCIQDPSGPFNSLAECQANCIKPSIKYRCSGSPDFQCIQDPSGPFNSLAECQTNCIKPSTTKFKIHKDKTKITVSVSKTGTLTADDACKQVCDFLRSL